MTLGWGGGGGPCWYLWATTPTCAVLWGALRLARLSPSPPPVLLTCPSTSMALRHPHRALSPACHRCLPPVPTPAPRPLCTTTVRLHARLWPPSLPSSSPAPKVARGVISTPCLLSGWQSCKLHNLPQRAESLRTRTGSQARNHRCGVPGGLRGPTSVTYHRGPGVGSA